MRPCLKTRKTIKIVQLQRPAFDSLEPTKKEQIKKEPGIKTKKSWKLNVNNYDAALRRQRQNLSMSPSYRGNSRPVVATRDFTTRESTHGDQSTGEVETSQP